MRTMKTYFVDEDIAWLTAKPSAEIRQANPKNARYYARLDAQARGGAKRPGWYAHKSRAAYHPLGNQGGFRIIEPSRNLLLYGEYFELCAQDVIELCQPEED